MKKIFTNLFLLATIFMASTSLSAQTYIINDGGSYEVMTGGSASRTKTFSIANPRPCDQLTFNNSQSGWASGGVKVKATYFDGSSEEIASGKKDGSHTVSLNRKIVKQLDFWGTGTLKKTISNIKLTMSSYADAPTATSWNPTAVIGSADETVSNYTISSSIGIVNGNKITIPYNPNTSDRNITVTVNVSGQTVTKTIVQTKNIVTYSAWQLSASSNVSSVASSGGTVTITASAWRTYTNSNGQPGGTQNGTISYSPSVGSMSGNIWNIPENTENPRTNTIVVSCVENPSLTKTITVTQDSTSGGGTGGEESDWELKTSFKTKYKVLTGNLD